MMVDMEYMSVCYEEALWEEFFPLAPWEEKEQEWEMVVEMEYMSVCWEEALWEGAERSLTDFHGWHLPHTHTLPFSRRG